MNIYLQLFLTFAKIGVVTFGGGAAMLPILQREVVENKHWATEEELVEKANAAAYLHLTPCKPTAKEVAAVKPDANAVRSVNAALAAEFARVTNPAKK